LGIIPLNPWGGQWEKRKSCSRQEARTEDCGRSMVLSGSLPSSAGV
jgi:hypothetical protein